MSDSSASQNYRDNSVSSTKQILVWDAPVRVFHWLLVVCFVGAYATGESERWRLVHLTLGYTAAALVAFRIVWGLIGTRYARFSSFVRGPTAAASYLMELARGRHASYVGHNPAGGIAILMLLIIAIAISFTGWAAYNDIGGAPMEELHEGAVNVMLALVALHVLGVIVGSLLHRENLVWAMISGRKSGRIEDGIHDAWRTVAVALIAAVLAFWWLQLHNSPVVVSQPTQSGVSTKGASHGSDDD
ncbi:cytochrome B (plasmid) [Burkholderia sp. KK1]|nr:cytochrome B [Burkholderia sp. KK1]